MITDDDLIMYTLDSLRGNTKRFARKGSHKCFDCPAVIRVINILWEAKQDVGAAIKNKKMSRGEHRFECGRCKYGYIECVSHYLPDRAQTNYILICLDCNMVMGATRINRLFHKQMSDEVSYLLESLVRHSLYVEASKKGMLIDRAGIYLKIDRLKESSRFDNL
jgi:hypothetical protein